MLAVNVIIALQELTNNEFTIQRELNAGNVVSNHDVRTCFLAWLDSRF